LRQTKIVFLTPRYRDSALKGHLSYRQALVIGIVISVCTGIFYPNFLANMINARLATMPASERTPEFIAAMREGTNAKTIALSNLIRLSLFGTWLSIFLAFYLKDKQKK
jgi:hypothetical protein